MHRTSQEGSTVAHDDGPKRNSHDGEHQHHAQQGPPMPSTDTYDAMTKDDPRKERMSSAQSAMPFLGDPYGRATGPLQHFRSTTDNGRPQRASQYSPPQLTDSAHAGAGTNGNGHGGAMPQGPSFGGPLDAPFNLSPSLRFDRSRSSASDRASATSGINDSTSSFGLTSDQASSRSFISPPPALSAFGEYAAHAQQPYHQHLHQAPQDGLLAYGSGGDGRPRQVTPPFEAQLDRNTMAGFKLPADKMQNNRFSGSITGSQLQPGFLPGYPLPDGDRRAGTGRPPSVAGGWTEAQLGRIGSPNFLPSEGDQVPGLMSTFNNAGMSRPMSGAAVNAAAALAAGMGGPNGGAGGNQEFSIFVGDLSPDLREEDLVNQFLQPPPWPPSHPFAIVHAHAQQAQGNYNPPARIGPAPFLSTKSAKIMTDPVTGMSRGFGFVRFTHEADCARALVEMQGVMISPSNGLSPGRPLRVCTATPKNRNTNSAPGFGEQDAMSNYYPGVGALPNFGPNLGALGGRPPQHHGPSGQPGMSGLPPLPPMQMPTVGSSGSLPRPNAPMAGPEVVRAMSPAANQSAAAMLQANARNGERPPPLGLSQALSQLAMPPPPGAVGPNGFAPPPGSPTSVVGPNNAASASSMLLSSSSALDPNNTTVFVGGLSSLISEETLKTFFVPFGEITYVKIPPGKGCGFVQFVRKADAERAIERMQGFPIGGGRIRLSWGRSQGDKAAAAAAQAAAQAAQLGHLAGLAGLSGLSATQLAQLAGLSSALSAVQRSAAAGNNFATHTDANSALLQQIAASLRNGNGSASNSAIPQPTSPQSGPQQHVSSHHDPESQTAELGQRGPGQHPSPPGSFDVNSFSALNDPRSQQQLSSLLGSLGRHSLPNNGHGPYSDGTGNDNDALNAALAKMSLDPTVLGRLRDTPGGTTPGGDYGNSGSSTQAGGAGGGRPSPRTNLLKSSTFSPFSPAISPVVGGSTQLPQEDGQGPAAGQAADQRKPPGQQQPIREQSGRLSHEYRFDNGRSGNGGFDVDGSVGNPQQQDDILRALMSQQQYGGRFDPAADQGAYAAAMAAASRMGMDPGSMSGGLRSPPPFGGNMDQHGHPVKDRNSSAGANSTPLARAAGALRSPPPSFRGGAPGATNAPPQSSNGSDGPTHGF